MLSSVLNAGRRAMMGRVASGAGAARAYTDWTNAGVELYPPLPSVGPTGEDEETNLMVVHDGHVNAVSAADLFKGRFVLFGLPAAFSPTCSDSHVPGFVKHAHEFKALGIERLVCLTTNDTWVLSAWAKELGAEKDIMFFSDGNAQWTLHQNLAVNLADYNMGIRTARFAALVENNTFQVVLRDNLGQFSDTSAERMLEYLKNPEGFQHQNP